MSYELLERAPEDHHSEKFLQFLRDNNEAIEETAFWLIITNCKYDMPSRRWYTAFWKHPEVGFSYDGLEFLDQKYSHLNWLIKPIKERSVKRFHVHLYETYVE